MDRRPEVAQPPRPRYATVDREDALGTLKRADELFALAAARHRAGELEPAVALYRDAIVLRPNMAEAHYTTTSLDALWMGDRS